MADGSIRVNTGLNLEGLKKDIKLYKQEIAKANKELENIQKRNDKGAKQIEKENKPKNKYSASEVREAEERTNEEQQAYAEKVGEKEDELMSKVQHYEKMLDEATKKYQKMQAIMSANKQLDKSVADDKFADSIKSQEQYNSILEETERKMARIEAEAGKIAQNTGVNKGELLSQNSTYQKLADQYKILTSRTFEFEKANDGAGDTASKKMGKAKKIASEFGADVKKIIKSLKEMALVTGSAFGTSIKNGLSGLGARLFGGKSDSAFGASIKKGIKSLKTMTFATFGVRGAYMALRQAVSNYLQSNEALASQMEVLKGTFSQAIGPAIEYVINLLMKAVSYVNTFINALTGINLVAKANAAALKKQGDAAKSSRQSAGFDEQTKLSDSSGGGSSTATIDAFSEMPDFLEKIKEQILADDWYGAGQTLGKSLMDGIEGVDWESMGSKIGEWIGNAFEFALGLLTEFDAATLLEKANEFLTGLFDSLSESIQSLDWKEIGKKLLDLILVALAFTNPVTAILALMLAPDGDKMAESASEFVGSLVGALVAALAGMGERIGEIWQAIKDYFDDYVDWDGSGEDIIKGLLEGIGDALLRIGEWIKTHMWEPFKKGFKKAFGIASPSKKMKKMGKYLIDGLKAGIGNIWKKVKSKFTDFLSKIQNFIKKIKSKAKSVGKAFISGLKSGIGSIWKKVKSRFESFLSKIQGLKSRIKSRAKSVGKSFISGLKTGIGSIWKKVKSKFTDFLSKIQDMKSKTKSKAKSVGKSFISGLKSGIGNIWEKVKSKFSDFLSKAQNMKTDTKSKAKSLGTAFSDGLKEGLDALKDKLKSPINAVIGMVEKAINWIIKKLNKLSWEVPDWVPSIGGQKFGFNISTVSIPRLAKGGIVNNIGKGVPLIAGEAGKEAILPLENNTEWMDILVDKINSGNTTIPIYLDGKLIAKYIIDLQKRRAFATNGG